MALRSRSPETRSCGRSTSVRTRSRAVPDGPAVAVRGLDVAYGAIRAVQGVDIDAPRGQITALIGSNGAGKSSTLNAIAGLVPVAGGSVEIGGGGEGRVAERLRVVWRRVERVLAEE